MIFYFFNTKKKILMVKPEKNPSWPLSQEIVFWNIYLFLNSTLMFSYKTTLVIRQELFRYLIVILQFDSCGWVFMLPVKQYLNFVSLSYISLGFDLILVLKNFQN